MIKVSVIMPIYNSEKYIGMAIESVLNQTMREWELILIDDGSKDKSLEVCRQYAEREARIRVLSHENHGISYTRNVGIKEAKGEYIAFIDNDDEYLPDLLEKAYTCAKENSAEFVKYGYRVVEDWHKSYQEGRIRTFRESRGMTLTSKIDYKELCILREDGFFNMVWNGIYKNEFLKENNLFFDDEVTRGYEDWIFNYQLFPLCKNIYMLSDVEYIHYQRTSHSTSSNFHINQITACIRAMEAEQKMIKLLESRWGNDLKWNNRAMEYFIEYLLLFQRPGCNIKKKEEEKYIRSMLKRDELRQLGRKEACSELPKTQKILSKLIAANRIKSIILVTGVYNHYLIYKRKRGKTRRS